MAHEYLTNAFFGIRDRSKFIGGINTAIQGMQNSNALFAGDNLITSSKNLSFLHDAEFMEAYNGQVTTEIERGII